MLGSGIHVDRVPIDDRGDDQVEAGCAIFLCLMTAVDDPTLAECVDRLRQGRSEEHTSELQSLMRISYAVFCLKKKKKHNNKNAHKTQTIHVVTPPYHI